MTAATASSEASTLRRLIEDWKSTDESARSSRSRAAKDSVFTAMMARSLASVILAAVKCAAPGGILPPDPRAALRMKSCARSTAAAAIPAQTDHQHRSATGVTAGPTTLLISHGALRLP